MKLIRILSLAIITAILITGCNTENKNKINVETESLQIDNSKIDSQEDWLSELITNSTEYPLPSIRQKAINTFLNSPYEKTHKLLAISHMNDNRIALLSTTNKLEEEKMNVEYWVGWAYNEISDNLTEEKWDVPNFKKVSEIKKEYVLKNILFPYNEQGVNEIKNVIEYIHSEFDEFSLSYLAAYNDYYVLRAFEETQNTTYTGLQLYIDYEGKLLEVEKYQYNRNTTGSAEFIEFLDMRSNEIKSLSRDQALELLKPFVKLLDGQDFGDGSIREIDGREYYLFTVFSEYTVDAGYCVDVTTGELYSVDVELTLTPLSR